MRHRETCLAPVRLVVVDQAVGGTVVGSHLALCGELWQYSLGKLLTELHSPLIERVDIPDDTLRKNLHLVDSNQASKSTGGEFLKHEGIGGTVAFKHLVRDEFCNLCCVHILGFKLSLHSLGGLSKSKGFRLGKVVGQQDWMVIDWGPNSVGKLVVGINGRQEIARNHFGTLVNQLVESVLAIGSRLAPKNGSSLHAHLFSVPGDVLPVGLHISLLEVRRKAMHVLIIRQNGNRFGSKKVVVPNSN
mmetsp:Transcript_27967/g.64778  ORF Transcript_27967/g.64778 Transcript_27967/m.64778 type:complete len:246 (-) Transcript_27967:922-1659(-)